MEKERTVPMKPTKPNLPNKLPLASFDDLFDEEDPYIEGAHFINDVLVIPVNRNVEFKSVHFEKVRFIHTSLQQAYFKDCFFDHCELVNAEFTESTLKQVHFKDCRLNGVSFAESVLEDIHFEASIMDLVGFGYATQKRTLYSNCSLKEADFYANKLKHISFEECEMSGVGFTGTSLNKIDLSSSRFDKITVDLENLKGAIVNEEQALGFLSLLGLEIKE
jgi:uncharacterized protein YjbI with pentapeptide repeats